MTAMLILVSFIVMACIFFNKISDKIGMPMLLVFILLGMVFGSDGIFRIEFENYVFAEQICSVALIFIIFYGGFGTKWSEAKKVAGRSLLLSSAGVVITCMLTGLFCWLVLGFEVLEGFLIGAVVSSTDAASVFSILRSKKLNLKYRTASMLELESGSNDPWAYMLTVIILSMMKGSSSPNGFFHMLFSQVIFGVVFGGMLAVGAVIVLKNVKFEAAGFDAIFVAAVAILSYAASACAGGNGYLSAYIVGIVLGNVSIPNKKPLVHFFDGITGFMQILIFFLLGLVAFPSHIPQILLPAVLIFLFLLIVARPLSVLLLMTPLKAPLKQQCVISWAGLRGATSIVFAIIATVDEAYTKNDIFHIVFCIVLISIGVQGTLLPAVSKRLKMIDNSSNVMKTFNDYSEETEVQFIRINVTEGSSWAGKKIKDISFPPSTLIALIIRGNERVIPTGKTLIEAGDILVLSAEGFYDDSAFILSEVAIDNDHEWCQKSVSEISMPANSLIVMIKRNGRTLIPNGRIKIKSADILVVATNL